jgi:hypothetical protein
MTGLPGGNLPVLLSFVFGLFAETLQNFAAQYGE